MSKISIMIDAGHYGKYNRSPAVPAYNEAEAMWKLHLMFREELEKLGIQAPGTRKDQTKDLYVTNRGLLGKDHNALISMHSNSTADGKTNEDVDYVRAYCLVADDGTDIDEESMDLGRKLAKAVAEVMGVKQGFQVTTRKANSDKNGDGVLNDNYYGILNGARQANVPAVILEHSFHTNSRSTKWLMDDSNLRRLAQAEAKVIAEHYGVEVQEKWYRIREIWDKPETQKGAYLDPQMAIDNCPEGYSVYNWNGNCVYYNGGGEFVTDQRELFIRAVQAACGAAEDGIAGPETLSKTVTISATFNSRHTAVAAVQEMLSVLGYEEVGTVDGIAGPKFTSALAHFQQDHECTPTGLMEEWGKTWQKLLGIK